MKPLMGIIMLSLVACSPKFKVNDVVIETGETFIAPRYCGMVRHIVSHFYGDSYIVCYEYGRYVACVAAKGDELLKVDNVTSEQLWSEWDKDRY